MNSNTFTFRPINDVALSISGNNDANNKQKNKNVSCKEIVKKSKRKRKLERKNANIKCVTPFITWYPKII